MKGKTYDDFRKEAETLSEDTGKSERKAVEISQTPIQGGPPAQIPEGDAYIMGVDPGKTGAISLIHCRTLEPIFFKFSTATLMDTHQFMEDYKEKIFFCFLEEVHAMTKRGPGGIPVKQGTVSAFTFGQRYGWMEALLLANNIRFERVKPLFWQTRMRCRSGGDKKVTKARAQELYPAVRFTEGTADAFLIAECGRRILFNIAFR